MKLKYILFLFAFLAHRNLAVAQQMSPQTPLPLSLLQVTPTSPEAATLIRNIQYPVNYGHGSVDITIPLYEIRMGDVAIPISLSYNHKGLRTNEFTPYLGQGWTLNAEPVISRKVNGKPDINCQYKRPKSILAAENDWSMRKFLSDVAYDDDAFPDEYFYRISGKSGEFIFKENTPAGGIATIPFEQIKVGYASNVFTLTDDNGVIYEFGVSEDAKTYKNETGNTPPLTSFPGTWKCTEIRQLDNRMTFSYQAGPETPVTVLTETMIIEDEMMKGHAGRPLPLLQSYKDYSFSYCPLVNTYGTFPYDNWVFEAPRVTSDNGTMEVKHYNLATKKIARIDFPGGYVRFNISNKRLSTIQVYSESPGAVANNVRTISLEHGSTSDGYPMLDAVTVTGAGVDEKYTLAYKYNKNYGHSMLRSGHGATAFETGSAVNFWGYWTGDEFSSTANNHIDLQYFNINFNRKSTLFETGWHFFLGTTIRTLKASTLGMLKSIRTKSGALTEFEYESDLFENTAVSDMYGRLSTSDMESGGLRIKTIKQSDHIDSSPVERHFEYSKGIAKCPITPDYCTTTRTIRKVDSPSGTWRQRIVGASLHGDITFSGTPIVYEKVTEIIKGTENGAQKIFGKNVYYYNNHLHTPLFFYDVKWPYDDKEDDWARGQLDKVETFKYNNEKDTYTKVKEVAYFHTHLDKDQIKAGEVFVTEVVVGGSGSVYDRNKIVYKEHPMKTGVLKLQRVVETLYDDNGNPSTSNETAYSYHPEKNEHAYPIAIQKTNSDGRVYRQEMKYTQDVSNRSDQGAINEMLARNILNPVLEQAEKTDGLPTITTYNYYRTFWLAVTRTFPRLSSVAVQSGSATPETRISYDKYDIYGHPTWIMKDGVTDIVCLWDDEDRLAAMVENADYITVTRALRPYGLALEAGVSSNAYSYDAIMNALRSLDGARVTSYKYKPLIGIAEITDPNGAKTTYEYDAKGRLTTVKDDKGSHTNSYTYGLYN